MNLYESLQLSLIIFIITILVLAILAILLHSLQYIFKEDTPVSETKTFINENDDDEKTVAYLVASIMLHKKYPNQDVIIKSIERIK